MFAAGAALSLVGYNKGYLGYLGNTAAGCGWLFRAARIIDGEVPELRGELLGATAYVTDDPVKSEALARHAAEIGRANGNSDLELMAMHAVGQALVQQGRTGEGMSLAARVCVRDARRTQARAGAARGRGQGCCAASRGAKRPLRGRLVASLTEARHRRLRLSCVRGERRRARTGLMSLR
jgi:hypothetical protein